MSPEIFNEMQTETSGEFGGLGIEVTMESGVVKEIIFALSSTMEGDTTNFYIYKQIQDSGVVMSTIARGISVGDELEYADEVTLGRSITNRVPFEISFKS